MGIRGSIAATEVCRAARADCVCWITLESGVGIIAGPAPVVVPATFETAAALMAVDPVAFATEFDTVDATMPWPAATFTLEPWTVPPGRLIPLPPTPETEIPDTRALFDTPEVVPMPVANPPPLYVAPELVVVPLIEPLRTVTFVRVPSNATPKPV